MPLRKPKPPTRILVTRHGQTEGNRDGLFCGHSETALTDLGREQALALGRRLAGVHLDAVYTSDLSRAMDTARIALDERAVPTSIDADLRELHYGEWELQKERLIRKSHPEQFALMEAEDPDWHPPGGENIHLVRARTFAALQRIAKRHGHQTVLIVTHGTAINCMLAEVLGMAPAYTFRFSVTNCGLSEVEYRRGKPVVTLLNDRSHLVGLLPAGRGVE